MGGTVTEEQAISRAQYLDLVYSHLGTLYDLIDHAPCPTSDPSRLATEPPVDGILGSVQTQTAMKSTKKKNQPVAPVSQPTPPTETSPPPIASLEVNAVQSIEYLGGKNKGKNKSKKYDNEQEGNRPHNPDADSKNKRKVKYLCLIFGGDHFT